MQSIKNRLDNVRLAELVIFYICLFALYLALPEPLWPMRHVVSIAMLLTIGLTAYACALKLKRR